MKAAAPHPVLLSETQIQRRIADLGEQISKDYRAQGALCVVGILKGSFIFVADLIRSIDPAISVEVDFMTVGSYGNSTKSSNDVRVFQDVRIPIEGRDIILVEDVVDTGRTLLRVRDILTARGAGSIRIATLLEKPGGREVAGNLDYVGFKIEDHFVVGYGLDYAERYRNLRDIRVLNGF